MICPYCHRANRDSARFCDGCGYELPTVAPIAREIFGPDDELASADTVDMEENTARLGGAGVPFSGLDQINDSSYSPRTSASARSDDTQTFMAPVAAQEGYRYIAQGVDETPYSWAGHAFSSETPPGSSEPPKKGRHGLRAALIIALCVVALAIAAAGLTYYLELWGGRVVEDVAGMEATAATVALTDQGFLVERQLVKSDEVEGIVLSTDPAGGSRIPEGSTVVVSVSVPRIIPNVVGLSLEAARSAFAEEEFANVEYTEKKSDEAESTVLSVSPEPGTRSKADAKIMLEVAVPYRVPAVAGLSPEEAAAVLQVEGYASKVAYVYDENVEEGRVIGTDPAADSPLPSGSEVTLNVAKHRSSELVALTRAWLKDSPRLSIGGVDYELSEVSAVSYAGNNACSYTVVARPFETHSWFGVDAETRYGNYERISGTMTWDDSDQIQSTDPVLKRL